MLIEAGHKYKSLYLIQSGRLGAWIFPDEKDQTLLHDVKEHNTITMHKGRRVRVRGVRALVFEFSSQSSVGVRVFVTIECWCSSFRHNRVLVFEFSSQ